MRLLRWYKAKLYMEHIRNTQPTIMLTDLGSLGSTRLQRPPGVPEIPHEINELSGTELKRATTPLTASIIFTFSGEYELIDEC